MATFRWSNLRNANLINADLTNAMLNGTNLDEADLSRGKLGYTFFGDIDLSTVKGLEMVNHQAPLFDVHGILETLPIGNSMILPESI